MAWFTANWFWVLIFIASIAMHLFHGGHGGHGGIINQANAESINRDQQRHSIHLATGLFEKLSPASFTTPTRGLVCAEMMGTEGHKHPADI